MIKVTMTIETLLQMLNDEQDNTKLAIESGFSNTIEHYDAGNIDLEEMNTIYDVEITKAN